MKNLLAILCVVLFSLMAVSLKAQSNRPVKPSLFTALPSVINCTSADLNKFFLLNRGQQKIQTTIAEKLNINGVITNNEIRYEKLHTVNIKLAEFNDAIFTISKRLDANNKPVFVGHIFPKNSADGYELKKTGEDTYQFIKINIDDILPTCAQP